MTRKEDGALLYNIFINLTKKCSMDDVSHLTREYVLEICLAKTLLEVDNRGQIMKRKVGCIF